jgi:hypothetical protein
MLERGRSWRRVLPSQKGVNTEVGVYAGAVKEGEV